MARALRFDLQLSALQDLAMSRSPLRSWLVVVLALELAPSASQAGTVPPSGYRFETPGFCREDARLPKPRPGQAVYDVCADQMALYAKGIADAKAQNKLLLVTFGATWCPSCASLQKAIAAPDLLGGKGEPSDLGRAFHQLEIGISTLDKGVKAAMPSGEAVLQLVLTGAPGVKVRAIPFVVVIDPAHMERIWARNIDDIEGRGGGFDLARLRVLLGEARVYVRGGGVAPNEPGWFMRKWQRWWNG